MPLAGPVGFLVADPGASTKESCSGFLADERLCPGRAVGVPDPEFNDDLTWCAR
jgi:hypothetical protein